MPVSLDPSLSELRSLVGQELGGFRLTRILGEGGMAVVFEGRNLLDDEMVRAVKVVKPHLSARPEFLKRFAAEARALDRLQHPNVVRFYGFRAERGLLMMELEMLDGRALADALPKSGRLDPQEAVRAVLQAAEGVAAAHALGIVHRDIKPDNIFLTRQRTAKVLDFGLARALDAADRAERATVVGQVPGTPAYMPPEVCNGAEPGAAADVYALGMTLYELLLGHHPFRPPGQPAPSALQLMRMQEERHLQPLARAVPGLPPGLDPVIARATAKNPSERYTNARELADALRAVATSWAVNAPAGNQTEVALPTFRVGTPSSGTNPTSDLGASLEPTPSGRPAGGRGWIVPAVAGCGFLMVGAVAIVGYLVSRGARSEAASEVAAVDPRVAINPWVRVDAPSATGEGGQVVMGLAPASVAAGAKGFHPDRAIHPPTVAFDLQAHEVSWAELRIWNEKHPDQAVKDPDWIAGKGEAAGTYAAGGVPWQIALAYCNDLGGSLPTEEQWEWAARGPELRPFPWGAQPLDPARTRVYQGEDARPGPVKGSDQDRTPGTEGSILYDLLGNAQEWTADLYRADEAGADESWVAGGGWRSVRGLPLTEGAASIQPEAAAYREAASTSGAGYAKLVTKPRFQAIGFRCAKPAGAVR